MEMSDFITSTFAFRDNLHILHLKTDSYSEHKALQYLYTFILEWVDGFAEAWQGYDKLLEIKDFSVTVAYDSTSCIEAYVKLLRGVANELNKDVENDFLVNEIQTALSACNKTLYKLYNLS